MHNVPPEAVLRQESPMIKMKAKPCACGDIRDGVIELPNVINYVMITVFQIQ